MDMKSQIEKMKSPLQELLEAVQNLSEHVDKMESTKATPEPKEPETLDELCERMLVSPFEVSSRNEELQKAIVDFGKRRVIADYCGRREWVRGEKNWHIHPYKSGMEIVFSTECERLETSYFPTKEAAEKYLKICQNSNLL